MTSYEYGVSFVLDNSVIQTVAIIDEEDEDRAIAQAEDRLAYDGIDLSKLDILDVSVEKTGEYA